MGKIASAIFFTNAEPSLIIYCFFKAFLHVYLLKFTPIYVINTLIILKRKSNVMYLEYIFAEGKISENELIHE